MRQPHDSAIPEGQWGVASPPHRSLLSAVWRPAVSERKNGDNSMQKPFLTHLSPVVERGPGAEGNGRCCLHGALQPGRVHRSREAPDRRRARSQAYQHVVCRAAESQDAVHMRRFTRLTDAFSKEVENHVHSQRTTTSRRCIRGCACRLRWPLARRIGFGILATS